MPKTALLIEIFLFYGLIMGWGFWELHKTSRLQKEREASENKEKTKDDSA